MKEPLFFVQCPTCESRLRFYKEDLIGQIVPCPKCGSMVLVKKTDDVSSVGATEQESEKEGTSTASVPNVTPPSVPPALPAVPPTTGIAPPPPPENRKEVLPPTPPPVENSEDTEMEEEIPLSKMLFWVAGIAGGIFVVVVVLFFVFSKGGASSSQETVEEKDPLAISIPVEEVPQPETPIAEEEIVENAAEKESVSVAEPELESVFQSEMGKLLSGEAEIPEAATVPEKLAEQEEIPKTEPSKEEKEKTTSSEIALEDAPKDSTGELVFERKQRGVEFEEDLLPKITETSPVSTEEPLEEEQNAENEEKTSVSMDSKPLMIAVPRPEKEYLPEEIAAAFDLPLNGVQAEDRPLSAWLKWGSLLSGISIYADWTKLRELGIEGSLPVSLKLEKTTLRDAMDTALASCGLGLFPNRQGLKVLDLDAVEIYRDSVVAGQKITNETLDISDLASKGRQTTDDAQSMMETLNLIRTFVHPGTWDDRGGFGRVTAVRDPSRIRILQYPAMHQEIEIFCDKLRHLRKIPQHGLHSGGEEFPRGKQDGTALADAMATSLWDQSKKACQTPIQCDFSDGVSLRKALESLCEAAHVRLVVEENAIAQISVRDLIFDAKVPGYDGKTKELPATVLDMRVAYQFENITFQNAVSDVMKDFPLVCYPVKADVFCLTTPQAAEKKRTLEFYPVGDLFSQLEVAKVSIDNIKKEIAPKTWRRFGGSGEIVFDVPGRALIVLQNPRVQFEIYYFLEKFREQSRVSRGRKEPVDE